MPRKTVEELEKERDAARAKVQAANKRLLEKQRRLDRRTWQPADYTTHRNHLKFLIASAALNYAAANKVFKAELLKAVEAAKETDRTDQEPDYDEIIENWDSQTMAGLVSPKVIQREKEENVDAPGK